MPDRYQPMEGHSDRFSKKNSRIVRRKVRERKESVTKWIDLKKFVVNVQYSKEYSISHFVYILPANETNNFGLISFQEIMLYSGSDCYTP